LLRFQHLWAPQTVTFTGADSSEEEEASMGLWALGPLGLGHGTQDIFEEKHGGDLTFF